MSSARKADADMACPWSSGAGPGRGAGVGVGVGVGVCVRCVMCLLVCGATWLLLVTMTSSHAQVAGRVGVGAGAMDHIDIQVTNDRPTTTSTTPLTRTLPNPGAVVLPAPGKHSATVFFLHGLGDSGYGWADLATVLQQSFKHIKFVLPHASSQPVTLNGGMSMPSWHDIKSLHSIDNESFKGLPESKTRIENLIQDEIKSGIPSTRIILGGFSQGAGLSVFTAYQLNTPLAGVICLSGYLPHTEFNKVFNEAAKATPILIGHGTADQVVNPAAGEKVNRVLSSLGVSTEYHTYKNMAHSSCPQEIQHIQQFIAKQLPEQ